MCNTWGQNLIESDKDGCYLSNMGEVFRYFAGHYQPCTAAAVQSDDSRVFALATKRRDGEISLYLVNHAGEELEVLLPEGKWRSADGLRGKGRITAMQKDQPSVYPCQAQVKGETAIVPPLSITRLILDGA